MKINQTKIFIKKARFFAHHGVLEQERYTGANFYVNLEARVNFVHALQTDELTDTVSYADLFDIVRTEMETPSQLIEHVGGRILEHIFSSYPEVENITLEIIKENPPMGADSEGAGIRIEAARD